jgi:hypothetical protein
MALKYAETAAMLLFVLFVLVAPFATGRGIVRRRQRAVAAAVSAARGEMAAFTAQLDQDAEITPEFIRGGDLVVDMPGGANARDSQVILI